MLMERVIVRGSRWQRLEAGGAMGDGSYIYVILYMWSVGWCDGVECVVGG